jgi:cytochrome c peroxidase
VEAEPALLGAALSLLAACGSPGSTRAASPAASAAADDPDPVFAPSQRAALAALHYDSSAPAADPSNRVADDPRAQTFGQRLFFDTALSGPLLEGDNDGSPGTLGVAGQPGRVACSACHVPEGGFVDTRSPHLQISLAAQWSHRRTPTLLEVSFAPLYGWDGRRDAIWNQALGVMESDREFNSGRLFVAEQLFRLYRSEYEALFGTMPPLDDASRFPPLTPSQAGCQLGSGLATSCHGKPGDGAEFDSMTPADQDLATAVAVNATKAIEAYVRLLRCGPGRFDRWLDGDATALTRAEQRGAALFVGAAGCAKCHGGPQLADGAFHNVGMIPRVVAVAFTDTGDRGAIVGLAADLTDPMNTRGRFSDGDRGALPAAVSPSLEGAFRTPTLRCVSAHPSFMHSAQFATLDQVVEFFSRGGDPATGQPGTNELAPLGLSAREQADSVAFLHSLDGPGPPDALRQAPQ